MNTISISPSLNKHEPENGVRDTNPSRVGRSEGNPFGPSPTAMKAGRSRVGGGLLFPVLCFFTASTVIVWPFAAAVYGVVVAGWAYVALGFVALCLLWVGTGAIRACGILIAVACLCCGCRTYDFSVPLPDGRTATAKVRTFLNDANLETLQWSTNGLTITGYSQNVNTELVGEVAERVAKGVTEGAK